MSTATIDPEVDTRTLLDEAQARLGDVLSSWKPDERAEALLALWRVVDEAHERTYLRQNSKHTYDPNTCPICKDSAEMLRGQS